MAVSDVSEARTRTQRIVDAIAWALVAYAAMNLNGVVQMITSQQAALSVYVLAGSLFLLFACARREYVGPVYLWFIAFLVLYFVGGIVPLVTGGVLDTDRMSQYGGSIIFCSAIYFFVARRGDADGVETVLTLLQWMFLIDCIAAMNFRELTAFVGQPRVSERATGFFDNPNETAMMALYYVVVLAAMPPKSRAWAAIQFAVAVATLVLTFSKNGLLVFATLSVCYLLSRRAYVAIILLVLAVVLALPSLDFIASVNPFGFDIDRRRRVQQIADLLSGQIDDRLTTGRTQMWSIGLDRIAATFPFGAGLGSFHRIEGGMRDPDGLWLGVHNTFLMVLGESGLAAFIALLAFLVSGFRKAFQGPRPILCVGSLMVLVGDMMATHGVFVIRVHDLMLAIVMAASIATTPSRLRRTPLPHVVGNQRAATWSSGQSKRRARTLVSRWN